jgi:hypothetical protein
MSVGAPKIRLSPQSSTTTTSKGPKLKDSSMKLHTSGHLHLSTGYMSAILMKKLLNLLKQSHKTEQDIMGCMTVSKDHQVWCLGLREADRACQGVSGDYSYDIEIGKGWILMAIAHATQLHKGLSEAPGAAKSRERHDHPAD